MQRSLHALLMATSAFR